MGINPKTLIIMLYYATTLTKVCLLQEFDEATRTRHLSSPQQFLYVLLKAEWGSCGSITIDNIPIFINQKLGKVPLNAITQNSAFARFQELVYRSSFLTIDINLIKYGKFGLKASASELHYLLIIPGLLTTKLIAWECKNLQTLVFVLPIQLAQLRVIGIGQPTLRCNIHNQQDFPFILAKIHIISSSILDGEVVDRLGLLGLACHRMIRSQTTRRRPYSRSSAVLLMYYVKARRRPTRKI